MEKYDKYITSENLLVLSNIVDSKQKIKSSWLKIWGLPR